MNNELLIKNGRVIDPANGIDGKFDVLITNGVITEISQKSQALESANQKCDVIDAAGKLVVPGLIDMHVHFRQPGRHEYKETIRTGSRAAAKGGFTTVVCEPNTDPPIDNATKVKAVLDLAKGMQIINVYTKACITKGIKGKKLHN